MWVVPLEMAAASQSLLYMGPHLPESALAHARRSLQWRGVHLPVDRVVVRSSVGVAARPASAALLVGLLLVHDESGSADGDQDEDDADGDPG